MMNPIFNKSSETWNNNLKNLQLLCEGHNLALCLECPPVGILSDAHWGDWVYIVSDGAEHSSFSVMVQADLGLST